jgi:nucleoside phosphorylase
VIAVTFALPAESRDFRQLLRAKNHEIVIAHTGVGEQTSRAKLEAFLADQRFDFLISSGFAGSLDPSLGAGDLFLAENFSDPKLFAQARELLITQAGNLTSIDKIIEDRNGREKLAHATGARAVDMETATIAEICARHQLPMLSLRGISDSAAAPLPAPAAVLFDVVRQKTRGGKLAGYVLRHPAAFVRLLRFSRGISRARASLTTALAVLARELER